MKRSSLTIVIVCAWLVAGAWFIRYEAFPDFFTHTLRGYSGIFSKGVLVKDSWMKILFEGTPLGFTHTKVDVDERSVGRRYRIRNETRLNLNIMGAKERITTTMDSDLDALYRLQRFSMVVFARKSATQVNGRRLHGNTFSVTIDTGGSIRRMKTEIPEDTIIYSPMTDVAVSQLKPGQRMIIKSLEPITMTPTTILVRALEPETIEFNGRQIRASVLATEYMGMTTRSWLDGDGNLLRQETPLKNFIAEACDAEEAMAAGFTNADSADVLRSLAVRLDGLIIHRPRECIALQLKLAGTQFSHAGLESNRQNIQRVDGMDIFLEVRAAAPPPKATSFGDVPDELKAFLQPSPFIQSDHPDIVRAAKRITETCGDPLEAAAAITEWAYRKLEKTPSPGIPSAVDVLHNMEGDCNEHANLTVALARACGIPAKIKVGLLYLDGAFYYHAWPAFYVGDWLEMDPTLNQEAVDATHVALVEGELADQFELIRVIGRLTVNVLDQQYGPATSGTPLTKDTMP